MNKQLKYHLINKYRDSINKRYDYKAIKNDADFPKHFTKKTVDELKDFFLGSLYSEPVEREKLDAAFKQLESFVTNPSKIWGLMGNLTSAIFEFGLHFPSAIRAGVSALETHSAAHRFEQGLLDAAEENGYTIPLTDEEFHKCLTAIPLKQIDQLIKDLSGLFKVISDTELLGKTISIMHHALERMESKKNVYTKKDRDAVKLGIDLFQKGYDLLDQYDEDMKQQIVKFAIRKETDFLKSIHEKHS